MIDQKHAYAPPRAVDGQPTFHSTQPCVGVATLSFVVLTLHVLGGYTSFVLLTHVSPATRDDLGMILLPIGAIFSFVGLCLSVRVAMTNKTSRIARQVHLLFSLAGGIYLLLVISLIGILYFVVPTMTYNDFPNR
jgi:hypothetical protein